MVGCMLAVNALLQLRVLHGVDQRTSLSQLSQSLLDYQHSREEGIEQQRALKNSNDSKESNKSVDKSNTSTEEDSTSITSLLKNRHIASVTTVSVVCQGIIGMIEPLVPLYLADQFGKNVVQQVGSV